MLQIAKVRAFTVSELLRENQQEVKLTSTQIRVKKFEASADHITSNFLKSVFLKFYLIYS